MNLQEYQVAAARTNADLGSPMLNNIHMVLGLGSELSEYIEAVHKVDPINVGEELADMCWYSANYCTINGFDLYSMSIAYNPHHYDGDIYINLVNNISELNNLHKRELAYKKEADKHLKIKYIKQTFNCIEIIANRHGINIENILESNINKLKVRFPDKFSTEKALSRDLETERKELEK